MLKGRVGLLYPARLEWRRCVGLDEHVEELLSELLTVESIE